MNIIQDTPGFMRVNLYSKAEKMLVHALFFLVVVPMIGFVIYDYLINFKQSGLNPPATSTLHYATIFVVPLIIVIFARYFNFILIDGNKKIITCKNYLFYNIISIKKSYKFSDLAEKGFYIEEDNIKPYFSLATKNKIHSLKKINETEKFSVETVKSSLNKFLSTYGAKIAS